MKNKSTVLSVIFQRNLPVLLVLLLAASLTGCFEDAYGPPRKAEVKDKTVEEDVAPKPGEPVLVVGNTTMPMPAPDSYKRISADNPLVHAIKGGMPHDEVLLCIFEKSTDGLPNNDFSTNGLLRRDIIQVSTLNKWLNVEVSSLDFLKLKEPFQEEAVEFTQATLKHFEDAALTRLAEQEEFTYNLGMIDSSPLHVSFLQVVKHPGSANDSIYVCSTTSLVWRYGKIMRLTFNKHIQEFGQIQGVVAESVGYLKKLQQLDSASRLQPDI